MMRDVFSPAVGAPTVSFPNRTGLAQQGRSSLLERRRQLPPFWRRARRNPAQHDPLVRGHQGAAAQFPKPRRPTLLNTPSELEQDMGRRAPA